MKKELTPEQKDRIVKRYEEMMEKELEKTQKHLNLINTPGQNKLAAKLQERLVQCCIDYVKETGDTNIERIYFTADCLQESAKYGSWQPCTDSTCEIEDTNGETISYSA